jgi:hypothetical protein
MTKEELLQDWLPRLMEALKYVRDKENAEAEETIYELYVEMSQETLAEKLETFSEITLEDQMSAMAIELLAAQKRVANLELGICQRAFEAKQEQGEPVAEKVYDPEDDTTYIQYFMPHDLIPTGTKFYTTPQQRKPLRDEMLKQMKESCDSDNMEMRGAFIDGWTSAEAAHGIKE